MRATGVYIMFAITAIASWSGCYTTRAASGDGKSALLKLEVNPPEAHIYIDEQYQGRIDRWRDQTVPVRPGPRRVELQAEGYITQRFDVEIGAREEVTLTVVLEPEFDRVEPPSGEDQR